MKFVAVAVLIGCVLNFGQNATSSSLERRSPAGSGGEESYLPVSPGTRIYFHAIKNRDLMVGPRLAAEGPVTVYTLTGGRKSLPQPARYTVLKSGVLIPKTDGLGDPDAENVLRSRNLTFYVKGFKGILIPINVLYSKSKQRAIIDDEALLAKRLAESGDASDEEVSTVEPEKEAPEEEEPDRGVVGGLTPDKNCNGEITMFILKSDGVLQRMPPDPYLPMGIQLSYTVKDDLLIRPSVLEDSGELILNYLTGKNGDLLPHADNPLKLTAVDGDFVSFVLGECGSLIPVREEWDADEHINYYYNGRVIYRGRQFPEIFSNSQVVVINGQKRTIPGSDLSKKKEHSIRKRSLYPEEFIITSPPRPPPPFYPRLRPPFVGRPPVMGRKPTPKMMMMRRPKLPPVTQQMYKRMRMVLKQAPPMPPPPLARRAPIGAPVFDPQFPPMAPPIVPGEIPVPPVRLPVAVDPVLPPRRIVEPILPPRRIVEPILPPGRIVEPILPPRRIVEPILPPRRIVEPILPPRRVAEPILPAGRMVDPVLPPGRIVEPTTGLEAPSRLRVRTDLFAQDERGIKIPLVPELTEQNDIVLFKLTCKGHLVRFPPCKEPEHGFEINFQLLLDEFILVPRTKNNRPMHITYLLQENGDLIPLDSNENTLKKAPGSLIYFMLGKNNVLFPVQQKVAPDGCVSYYYQDYHLLSLPSTSNKPLHFSTLGRPLFAYVNGLTVITCSSKPRLNPSRGSNWKNLSPDADEEIVSKDVFLSGPGGQLIKVSPYKTKTGSTVVYEMDCNGILYRSPKDKKRCIILKSYILLKEGILLPSNDTVGYMYMTSKNGDMFPYLYPDGKLEAPASESIKYLLCERGILLPVELEIVDSHICYFFHDVIVYKERVYCKDSLMSLSDDCFKLHFKNDCDQPSKSCDKKCKAGVKPFMGSDGSVVYYEKTTGLLKRHPPDSVPSCLSYTMGSFEIQPDGSLFQIRYQDPDEEVINLMLEPNGDLLEDSRNCKKPRSNYYILDVNGNLIAVEGRKTKKSIYFYKNHVKVCRVKLDCGCAAEVKMREPEPKKTPLGRDPLNLLEDPEPGRSVGSHPMYIPVPLKSVTVPNPEKLKGCGGQDKCGEIKETMALELEINDEIIEEIKNWAARCDKLLSRREVEESLAEALKGLNVSGLVKEEPETR